MQRLAERVLFVVHTVYLVVIIGKQITTEKAPDFGKKKIIICVNNACNCAA